MPMVEVMIDAWVHAFKHDAAVGFGEGERLRMTLIIMLLPAGRQQRLRYSEVLDILVVIKSFTQNAHKVSLLEGIEEVGPDNFEARFVKPAHVGSVADRLELKMRNDSSHLTHLGAWFSSTDLENEF